MPSKIILALKILAGSAAAGAALLAVWSYDSVPSSERSPANIYVPAVAPAATSESRFFEPEAGYRYTYQFRRGISFQGDLGGASLPPVDFAGEFHVDVLRSDARAFEALVSEQIKGTVASPFVRIEADARGDQLSVYTSSPLTEDEKQHVSILKDLVALWLFPLRSDTVGAFEARFEPLVAEKGFAREKKTKLEYIAKHSNTPSLLSSQHYLLWSYSLHLPTEVKGAESTRLGAGPTALVAQSRYEIKFRDRSRSPSFASAFLKGLGEEASLALDTSKPGSMRDHPDYAKLDWNVILSQLQNLDKLTGMQQLNVFGDVLKYLKMHPEKTAELVSMLKDPRLLKLGMESPLFRNIVGALASFGSPEALAALRDAYDDPHLADSGRNTILAALTTTQAPIDAATREFLSHKMAAEGDPRLTAAAAFALGSALQNAPNDSQTAQAIAQLQNSYAAAHTDTDRLSMLDAMGNSGRTEFVSTLQSTIHDETLSAQVRARAVYALRFVATTTARQEIISAFTANEPIVRNAAAGAVEVAEWNESFRAPLEHCSQVESDVNVQNSCRKSLSNNTRVADSQ